MRPDAQIAALFGLSALGTTQTDSYLKIDDSQPTGQGLPSTTLQIHGQADRYTLNSATTIATLYSDASTATTFPAVITASFGSGQTAAFTYDLARNVAYMRQGNPANANQHTHGWTNQHSGQYADEYVHSDTISYTYSDRRKHRAAERCRLQRELCSQQRHNGDMVRRW